MSRKLTTTVILLSYMLTAELIQAVEIPSTMPAISAPSSPAPWAVPENKVFVESWLYPPNGTATEDDMKLLGEVPDQVRQACDFHIEPRQIPSTRNLTRCRAWLKPISSGEYHFWFAGDTFTRVYLQEEGSERRQIIEVGPGASPGQWDKFPAQRSKPCRLEAGRRYLLELIATRWWPADTTLEVAWEGPGFQRRMIPGTELAAFHPLSCKSLLRPDALNAIAGSETRISPFANDSIPGVPPQIAGVDGARLGQFRIDGDILVFTAGKIAGREVLYCRYRVQGMDYKVPIDITVSPALQAKAIQDQLLQKVNNLPQEFCNGRLLLPCGPQASSLFDIKMPSDNKTASTAVFGNLGLGRFMALPSKALEQGSAASADAAALKASCISWLSHGQAGGRRLCADPATADKNLAIQPDAEWRKNWQASTVLVVREKDLQPADMAILKTAVTSGKGLLIGVENNQFSPLAGLLLEAGVAVTDDRTDKGSFAPGHTQPAFKGGEFIQMILGKSLPKLSDPDEQNLVHDAEQMDWAMNRRWTAADGQFRLRPQDIAACNTAIGNTPGWNNEVFSKLRKKLLQLEATALWREDERVTRAHRSSLVQDGYEFLPKTAPRITQQTVDIDTSVTGYHPTGCFAPAGEPVTVKIPPGLAGRDWWVQISDTIFGDHLDPNPKRMPRHDYCFPVRSECLRIISPYGGLIYLCDKRKGLPASTEGLEPFKVEISGAVAAPLFILGKTSLKEWREQVSKRPAPRAELRAPRVAFTMRSSWIRDFDPTETLTFWDAWVAVYDSVNGPGHTRHGPERVCLDSESGAWAGYPLHGHDSWFTTHLAEPGESRDFIAAAGTLHELSHQAQSRPDNSLDGRNYYTRNFESTICIFDSVAFRKMVRRVQRNSWVAVRHYADEGMRLMIRACREETAVGHGGDNLFERKPDGDIFCFLTAMFGCDIWPKFIGSYTIDEDKNPGRLPKTLQEKRDQWLVRFSRISGYDMTRFFVDMLKLQVRDAALDEVKAMHLPVFYPAVGGISEAATLPGVPVDLNLAAEALSFDGVCKIGSVQVRKGGRIEPAGTGHWRFFPAPGFKGVAVCEYETISSSGFSYTNKLPITVSTGGVNIDIYPGVSGKMLPASLDQSTPKFSGYCDELRTPWSLPGGFTVRLRGIIVPSLDGEYTLSCTHSSTTSIWIHEEKTAAPSTPTSELRWGKGPSRCGGDLFKYNFRSGRRYLVEVIMEQPAPQSHTLPEFFPAGLSDNWLQLYWQAPGQLGLYPITEPYLLPLKSFTAHSCLPTQTLKEK